jgi:glycosyltransferase involved in cell wall biosynthesis
MPMRSVCLVTTSPLIVNFFLAPHLLHLAGRYRVALAVTLPGEVPLRALPGVDVLPVRIRRDISPLHDVAALLRLKQLYRQRGFDLVHSFGPKAGLLSNAAGSAARTRARLHTFTGQVWAARAGAMRRLLRGADRLTARLATHVFADSASQRDFLVREGVVAARKCEVLGAGSLSGVDLQRFRADAGLRHAVREELGIGSESALLLYLGRITRDKGVFDLARAFAQRHGDAYLAFVGPDEQGLRDELARQCGAAAPRVRFTGYTDAPERYLAAADLLCLPSYREGFGSVVIEAAAAGVPAVASRIYGVVDAVVDGETGFLFEPGNIRDLAHKLGMLLDDPMLRKSLGSAARARAVAHFSQDHAVAALAARYAEILGG